MRYCRTHHLKNPLSGIKFALSVTRLAESPENDGSMLSQHSLNKGRSKRLVSAVAALSLFFGAAHVAPTASAQEIGANGAKFSITEDEKGYKVTDGSKPILAELFSATSGSEKRLAYCNELEVNFHETNDAYAAKWKDFPGNNKFKTDENVRQKVNWIAANSYPAVSYKTVLQKAGVTEEQVSVKSVIAQTQAAIWNLGSGFDYKGLAQGEGTAEEQQNAKKVYEYLLGPANVGRAESTSVDLQVGFKGKDSATRQANGTFGPFTLDTNADSVEVTAETGQVVDKKGNAFPANEIKNGQEFYFKAAETAGEAKLVAKAASSEVNGALIISPKQGGNGYHQTLIVTHDKEKTKNAELYIKWEGTNASLSTTAHKKGDEHSQRVKSKGGTIIDVVAYKGLIVGKKYTLKGQMYERVKKSDGTVEAVPTGIKAQKEFTPTQPNDEVHLEFEIPEGYAGKTLVVFEEAHGLDANGKDGSIATHTDINDENQTIYVNWPHQDMSSDSSAAKTGSAGAMFAGSSKCFSGGAAGGSSKKEDKNKGSLGDLFAGSSSLFGGDKDKDKGGSDSNGGSTNSGNGNGQANGGSNIQNGSNGGTTDSSSNKDKKDNGSTGGSSDEGNGNGGGNGGANGGSDTKTGSNAGGDAGSGGGAGSSDKDKKDNGSNTSSSGDNKGDGKGEGGSDAKSGSDINSTSDTKGGSAGGAGSSGEGKGNGGANGGSDTQNGSDPENKNGSAALAGSTSGGADCGALALGALVIGGLVLTATGFSVLPKNAAPAPLAGAADPKSDTKGAAPAAGDPNKNNKNAANANTKGVEPKEKGVAHKDPNTSKMDVKSASPAKSNSALANTGVSGILIMLAIAAVAAVAGGALIFFGRRKKN